MGSALSKAPLQRLGSLKANEWSLTIMLRMFRQSSAMTTNIFLRNIASWRACGWCSGNIAHHILLDQWHHQTICKIFAIKTILSRDGTYFLFYSASLFQLPSYHVRQLDYIHFIISKITVIYHVKQFISENIDQWGSNWPLGAKMCFFDPKIWIFGAKSQFFV